MTAPTKTQSAHSRPGKHFRLLVLSFLAIFAATGLSGFLNQEASAKSRKKRRSSSKYLVPPPPAYMPSILPELYHKGLKQEKSKKENSYSKYIYTSQGHEEPAHKKPNKHVTYWNVK